MHEPEGYENFRTYLVKSSDARLLATDLRVSGTAWVEHVGGGYARRIAPEDMRIILSPRRLRPVKQIEAQAREISMMQISGIEAHWLLFALDHYCATDKLGKITIAPCADPIELQSLRDRLFAAHEHPDEI